MSGFTAPPPLSLYIHIPWCVRKCPYCDFNSHELREALPERAYVDALLADLEQDLPRVWGRTVETIFIGGGTPSLFSPEAIGNLLDGVRARIRVKPGAEITLEANPGTVEQGRFMEFRAAGVNRLSIGVQSFDDALLAALGRIHGRKEAIRAAEQAHAAGFERFNLDLMFGLPQQTNRQALEDIRTACALEPQHLSHYQLTLEPNTLFHRHPPVLPDDDALWAMLEVCQRELAERGYTQYEVSAYARPDARCAHNLNYWLFGDYLGIGAGAHAKLTDAPQGQVTRIWKIKHPRDYLARAEGAGRLAGEQTLQQDDLILEFMINALRLNDGFADCVFEARTGLAKTMLDNPMLGAACRGWIERHDQHCQPTAAGRRYLNDLLLLFMNEGSKHERHH
jgi:oxygen-independent coproporphyrinogen-3 oxidase